MTKAELLTRIQQHLDAGNSHPTKIHLTADNEFGLREEFIEEIRTDKPNLVLKIDRDPKRFRQEFPTLDGATVIWDASTFRLE